MSEEIIEHFQKEREKLNDLVMKYAGLGTKRFYWLLCSLCSLGSLSCYWLKAESLLRTRSGVRHDGV